MSTSKSISVALCTYNGERFLREQLDSIAAQHRPPAEIVIVDDRSTDSTIDILQQFAAQAPFAVRIHVNEVNLGHRHLGIARNFERAVSLCTGDVIFTADQDDIWLPQKTTRLIQILESDPELGAVYSDGALIAADGTRTGCRLSDAISMTRRDRRFLAQRDGLPVVLAMNKIYGSATMFDARLKQFLLPVPPHWWFDAWVGAIAASWSRLAFTGEQLYLYRIHANQNHGANPVSTTERIAQWRRTPREYWRDVEPQLTELSERLASANTPRAIESLNYLRGRIGLLERRAAFPENKLARAPKVLSEIANYHRFFNGWRSVVKDLTA